MLFLGRNVGFFALGCVDGLALRMATEGSDKTISREKWGLMPPVTSTNLSQPTPSSAPSSNHRAALSVVTTLFFMWGFLTCLNDILVPHLKAIFDLNYAQVLLIQFAFF